jgi:hypothetical protein
VIAEIKKKPTEEASFELDYFDKSDGSSRFVSLRKTFPVRLCVLDLCVFDDEGVANLVVDKPCPDNVIQVWRDRYEILQKLGKKIIRQANELAQKNVSQRYISILIPQPSIGKTFNVSFDLKNQTIHYNCMRIGRLCQSRANALLSEFCKYGSRPAYEVDFALDKRDEEPDSEE